MAHYKGLFRLKLFSWFVAINSFLGKSTNPAMFQELSRISNADAIEFFISELPENGIFIDIGANLGVITEEILKVKRCNAILFEPIPEYANHIRIKFRGNDNVVIENVALGDSTGNFSLYKDKYNLGWNTLLREKTTGEMDSIDIQMITFDDYAIQKNLNRIDLIKIDVEGAEYRVLKGMKQTLKRLKNKPIIYCEIGWGKDSHPYWEEEVEMFEWLFDHGYKRFDYNSICRTTDVILCPEGTTLMSSLKDAPDHN